MTGAGISVTVEDMVASPELHSKFVAGVSFRRFVYEISFHHFLLYQIFNLCMGKCHRLQLIFF